ncbi:hypothetical protein ACFQ67_11480 [Streptomyces sp. NPDC056488]|uniref:hypothetical protein n=1 Tax=Streptomyces sp. NPDC056488 TaxID=3345836 RepID=UPI0036BF085F
MQHVITVPPVDFQTNGHRAWPLLDAVPAQPKPVPAPKGPVPARFEQAPLDAGVKLIYRKAADRVRVAYDPEQIDALNARFLTNIYVDFTEGAQIDGLCNLARNTDKNSREMYAIMLSEVDRTGDAPAVIERITELLCKAHAEAQTPCPRYGWCIETGQHVEHTGESVEPDFLEVDRGEVLAATITHWGKGIRVGFLDEDLTPADARTRLAELRAHLDAVEQLIATAEASE